MIVIAGKDKGKKGTVIEVLSRAERVVVEDVQVGVRHQKSRRRGSQGQIVSRAMPIHVSNVMLAEGGTPVRVGHKIEDGKKVRVSKKTGKAV